MIPRQERQEKGRICRYLPLRAQDIAGPVPNPNRMNTSNSPSRPNLVVVGYGSWGRQCHCRLIGAEAGLRLHGVVSGSPDAPARVRAEQGEDCRVYAALPDALADPAVDAVVLATPNATHAPLAIAALCAEKHVVTDKVMCLSLFECDAMIDAATQNRRVLTVFQNRRWDGDFLTAQHLWGAGRLGKVGWVEMAWQGMGAWGGWRGQAEAGGGRFNDLGAHLFDQLLCLFPQTVESVYCRTRWDYPHSDVESEALAVVTFAGGATGVIDLSGRSAISKPRFSIRGDAATWNKSGLDPQEDALKAGDISAAVEAPENYGHLRGPGVDEATPTLRGDWRAFYRNFAEVLSHGAAPAVTLAQARRVVAVMEAARASGRTGEVIPVMSQ